MDDIGPDSWIQGVPVPPNMKNRLQATKPCRVMPQSGFSLLEVLIGGAILAVALLGHTASLFSERQLSVEERTRSAALQTVDQFIERMHSDDKFSDLYTRMMFLHELSRRSTNPAHQWALDFINEHGDPDGWFQDTYLETRTDFVNLVDGRRAFAASAYYDTFDAPSDLQQFHVAVAVPSASVDGEIMLREDLPLQRFGLPADLNGDSVIDDQSHSDDYRALPVVLTFRWVTQARAAQEIEISSWMWGYR